VLAGQPEQQHAEHCDHHLADQGTHLTNSTDDRPHFNQLTRKGPLDEGCQVRRTPCKLVLLTSSLRTHALSHTESRHRIANLAFRLYVPMDGTARRSLG